jgi:hypothetical protein
MDTCSTAVVDAVSSRKGSLKRQHRSLALQFSTAMLPFFRGKCVWRGNYIYFHSLRSVH